MKAPRISIAAVVFAVLVLAVDLGVLRASVTGTGPAARWPVYALWLMPMIDVLMIALFRMRRPEHRTAGLVGFFVGGTLAVAATFVMDVIAPEAQIALLRPILIPFYEWLEATLTARFGNATMKTTAMQVVLGIGGEVIMPAVFFSGPPLAVALLGRTIGRHARKSPDCDVVVTTGPELA